MSSPPFAPNAEHIALLQHASDLTNVQSLIPYFSLGKWIVPCQDTTPHPSQRPFCQRFVDELVAKFEVSGPNAAGNPGLAIASASGFPKGDIIPKLAPEGLKVFICSGQHRTAASLAFHGPTATWQFEVLCYGMSLIYSLIITVSYTSPLCRVSDQY